MRGVEYADTSYLTLITPSNSPASASTRHIISSAPGATILPRASHARLDLRDGPRGDSTGHLRADRRRVDPARGRGLDVEGSRRRRADSLATPATDDAVHATAWRRDVFPRRCGDDRRTARRR